MRKIICCALALLLMMGAAVVPAAAAETKTGFYDFQDVDDVKITAKDATGPVTDGSDRMEVVYSKATPGSNYIVFLVEGSSPDVLTTDETKVYYVNEENKASGTSVTFNVMPKLPTKDMDMTLFITSDDGKATVSVSMKYAAGASADFMKGDIKIDGIIDIKDVTLLRRYLADSKKYPLNATQLLAAEIKEDKVIDIKDVTLLRRYLADSTKYPLP